MKFVRVFIISFVLIGIVFPAPVVMAQKNVYQATVDSDGVQKVNIVGGNYFFNPDYVIVRVNVPVELTVSREPGIASHDFTIKAPEAGIDISEPLSTDPKVIKFTPRKAGEYQFYCSKKFLFFESHKDKGMKGIIKVTE